MTAAAMPASGTPVVLETNGTVRDAARIHLEHVDHAVLDGVLHVEQADDAEPLGEGAGVPPHLLDLRLR